jgi:hypothetical protein
MALANVIKKGIRHGNKLMQNPTGMKLPNKYLSLENF